MRILGKIALSIVVVIASLIFLLLSFCAVNGGAQDIGMNLRDREIFGILALVIVGGIWAIGKLNSKRK